MSASPRTIAPEPASTDGTAPLMRVLHIVRCLETGGLESVVVDLATGLARDGFPPALLCLQRRGRLAETAERTAIPVAAWGVGEGLHPHLLARTAWLAARSRPVILHCHNLKPLFYAGAAVRVWPRAQLVLTVHGEGGLGMAGWEGRYLRAVARRGVVVAVSVATRDALRRAGWRGATGIEVIPNGVDTERFRPRERAAWETLPGCRAGEQVIGVVARLAPEKDHATLLRAFREVAARNSLARLVLVGDGPLRRELERQADVLGIWPRVTFLGDRADVADLLPRIDLFWLPSRREGLSLVLLEAMACGLPVVATRVGGNSEVVLPGWTGWLVPPGDPRALAEALLALLADPERRRAFGRAGRQRVVAAFRRDQMIARYEALYRRLATSGRRP